MLAIIAVIGISARRSRSSSSVSGRCKHQNKLLNYWLNPDNERSVCTLYIPKDSVQSVNRLIAQFPKGLIVGGIIMDWRIEYMGISDKDVYMQDPVDMYPLIPGVGTLIMSPLHYDAYISDISVESEVSETVRGNRINYISYKRVGPNTFRLDLPNNPTSAPRIYEVTTCYRELEEEATNDPLNSYLTPSSSTLKIYQLPKGGSGRDLPLIENYEYYLCQDR